MLGEFLPGNHGSAARRRGSDYRAHHIKTALAAAKARGKRLGTPDPAGAVERMRVARKAQAAQFAANVLPIIRDIQAAGHTSLNAIAGQLIPYPEGRCRNWRHVQVRQILDRASVGAGCRTSRINATRDLTPARGDQPIKQSCDIAMPFGQRQR
jgi:hypothetical protein